MNIVDTPPLRRPITPPVNPATGKRLMRLSHVPSEMERRKSAPIAPARGPEDKNEA